MNSVCFIPQLSGAVRPARRLVAQPVLRAGVKAFASTETRHRDEKTNLYGELSLRIAQATPLLWLASSLPAEVR